MWTLKSFKFITPTVITFKHFLEQVNNLSPLVFVGSELLLMTKHLCDVMFWLRDLFDKIIVKLYDRLVLPQ